MKGNRESSFIRISPNCPACTRVSLAYFKAVNLERWHLFAAQEIQSSVLFTVYKHGDHGGGNVVDLSLQTLANARSPTLWGRSP